MNKLKKLPLTLIIFSLIYVILEIMFRSHLLDVTATMQDNSEIIKLENVGRFLASFGFSIFVLSLIKIKKEHRNRTKFLIFISYPLIFILSFYAFMQGQKYLINNIAESITPQMKREMLLTSLIKEAIYFERIPVKPIYNSETKNDIDSKVFLSFFPALIVGSDLTKKYEPEVKKLVDITLTEKILKNKDDSNKEIENFIKNYLKSYQKALMNMQSGEKNNYTGFKEKEIKLMLNYISYNMSFQISQTMDQKIREDYFKIYEPYRYDTSALIHISESIFQIKDGSDFNYVFNRGIRNVMNFHFMSDINYMKIVDGTFERLVHNEDYSSLLKYYNFGYDMKKQCVTKTAEKNSISFYFSNNKEKIWHLPSPEGEDKEIFTEFYKQLNDRIPKEKYAIVCDYSYNRYIDLVKRTERYFKKVAPLYNQDKFSFKGINIKTINNNYYYKRMALNLMFGFIYENSGKNIITKFENFEEFERFRNSIIFSEKDFYKSINRFMYNRYLNQFIKRAKEDNLDFSRVLSNRVDVDFYIPAHFRKPEVIETFRKGMPFIINQKNEFFDKMDELTEKQKNDLRLYYVEHKKKIYNQILEDTKNLQEGEKYEKLGNDIAKAFIAPIFVLSISNIMIILSIINIFIKIIQVFEIKHTKLIQLILVICLICIPYFSKNRYSEHELFNKYPNKKMLNMVNWTQNTEYLLHNLDNDIYVFEVLYNYIGIINQEKEERE